MKSLPSLKKLYYLVHLHHEQNFNRAAKACFVSQSTLSTGIQNLEELLGQQLIERDHKSFMFTATGEEVVSRAKEILADVTDLMEFVQLQAEPMAGELKVGCIPTIAPFLISRLLAACEKKYPNLDLQIKEDTTEQLLLALGEGTLDLLILALPVDTGNFHSMTLGQDSFKMIVHKQFAGGLVEPLNYNALPDKSIFLLQKEHCITGHAVSACQLQDSTKVHPFSATSLHTLVQMVNSKLGATFLPQMAIESGILNGTDLHVFSPPGEAPYRDIGITWRQTSSRIKTFRTLGEEIKQLLK